MSMGILLFIISVTFLAEAEEPSSHGTGEPARGEEQGNGRHQETVSRD